MRNPIRENRGIAVFGVVGLSLTLLWFCFFAKPGSEDSSKRLAVQDTKAIIDGGLGSPDPLPKFAVPEASVARSTKMKIGESGGAQLKGGKPVTSEWDSFTRSNGNLFRYFSGSAQRVKASALFRHATLNPPDRLIENSSRLRLSKSVKESKAFIQALRKGYAKKHHQRMLMLKKRKELLPIVKGTFGEEAWKRASDAVARLNRRMAKKKFVVDDGSGGKITRAWQKQSVAQYIRLNLKDFWPGSAGWLSDDSGSYFATRDLLGPLAHVRVYIAAARQAFFDRVLAFFVQEGTLPPEVAFNLSEAFSKDDVEGWSAFIRK